MDDHMVLGRVDVSSNLPRPLTSFCLKRRLKVIGEERVTETSKKRYILFWPGRGCSVGGDSVRSLGKKNF